MILIYNQCKKNYVINQFNKLNITFTIIIKKLINFIYIKIHNMKNIYTLN